MKGPTMWIILGVLIFIVISFLLFSAIRDKKKRKKEKQVVQQQEKAKEMSVGKLAIVINILVKLNDEKLKKFVPSVGKEKMSDINNYAKTELQTIKKGNLFKMISSDKVAVENFLIIFKTKSNNWKKQAPKALEFFAKHEKNLKDNKEAYKKFKQDELARLKKAYKNDNSK